MPSVKKFTMSNEQAIETYGSIILHTGKLAIRAKKYGTMTRIYAHHVEDDVEQIPNGYVLGHNLLHIEEKE